MLVLEVHTNEEEGSAHTNIHLFALIDVYMPEKKQKLYSKELVKI